MRLTSTAIMVFFSICLVGCSQQGESKMQQQVRKTSTVHGAVPSKGVEDLGMVSVVKKQVLEGYASAPVGKAIDGYRFFSKKEWSESSNSKGTYYVDVTGWLDASTIDLASIKEGIAARGVQIKFVVYENGAFGVVMVSKVEAKTDGKMYANSLDNSKAQQVMNSIYANKELAF